MTTKEALETVLEMAHRSYSKSFGPAEHEHEALWLAEDYVDDLHRPKTKGRQTVIKDNYERGLSESDQALYLEEAERLRNKVAEELYNDLPRVD